MGKAGLLERIQEAIADVSIRNKLFTSFLVLNFIPLIIISALTYRISNSLIQEKTNNYTIDLLSEVSKNIELNLREIDRLYYTLFTNPDVREALTRANSGELPLVDYLSLSNRVSQVLYAALIDREDIESIQVLSLNGFMFHSGDSSIAAQLDVEDWDQIIGNKGNLIWLNPKGSSGLVAAASSIYDVDNLKKIGYFVLSFKKRALDEYYKHTKLSEQGVLFIMNQHGQIISHGNQTMINAQVTEAYFDHIARGGLQGNFTEMVEDREHVVTYQQIGVTPWKLVSVIPAENYSVQSAILRHWMTMIFAAIFVLAAILAYYLADSISKPIRQLSEVMKDVEHNRLDVNFQYHSRNEIGILSLNFNRMVKRISYLINQVYQEELLKQSSQLKYLMFQINPHFLFNTLETINWLARIQGVPDVGKLSKSLGDLMREAIKGVEMVTLDREITNVNKYVYIQKYRYADKFDIGIHTDPDTLWITVPRFILQPLVENAIVHGLELKLDKGSVEIRSFLRGEDLILTVRDDGAGMELERLAELREALSKQTTDFQAGIGLLNVHQRIRLHYGKAYGLTIDSTLGEGTFVQLVLPKGTTHSRE